MYKKRLIAEKMRKALKISRVLILTGARQTGKTTLLKNELPFKNYKYFSMDDLDTLAQAERDSSPILSSGKNIIIDEAQRVPKVLLSVKQIVDSNENRRFVLSGSANFLLLKNISETLAGRATYHTLYPFTFSELKRKAAPHWLLNMFKGEYLTERKIVSKPINSIMLFRGFLPPVLELEEPEEISMWWDGYIKTYLERDLRSLSSVASLVDFREVMELLALRTGSIVDQTDISRNTGISQPTVHRYINLLEASHLFIRLRPFTKTKSKSITKTPKGYFIDTGIAARLSGYRNAGSIDDKFKGHLFESLILANLLALADIWDMRIYFWRTRGEKEREIDFILEYGKNALPIEVKLSNKVKYADIQNILYFISITPNAVGGVVVYGGDEIYRLSSNIFAIPWAMLSRKI